MGKMLAGLALGFVALGANAQVNPDVMFADGIEDSGWTRTSIRIG